MTKRYSLFCLNAIQSVCSPSASKTWTVPHRFVAHCAIALIALTTLPTKLLAMEVALGVGGRMGNIGISNLSGSGTANYLGPAAVGELRFRNRPSVNLRQAFGVDFGFDFFGFAATDSMSNSGSGISEKSKNQSFGGGLDMRISSVYVGAQLARNALNITAGSNSQTYDFTSFGARAGLNLPINKDGTLVLALGGLADFGSAPSNGGTVSNINFTTYTGTVTLQWSILGVENAYQGYVGQGS